MRYNLFINQVKVMEWGLNLAQASVFSVLNEAYSWASSTIFDGEVYYWFSKAKLIEELPVVTDKPDTIVRHLAALEKAGLIRRKVIVDDNKTFLYIAITEKGKQWNVAPNLFDLAESEGGKNIRPSGNESETPRKNIPDPSEKSPTNTITSNPITSDPISLDSGEPNAKPKKSKRGSSVPDEFLVDQRMLDWLDENEIKTDWRTETSNFLDHHRAKGSKMADWVAAWRTWMRNSVKFARPAVPVAAPGKAQVSDSLSNIHDTDW